MSARGEGAGQPSTSAQGQPAAPAPQKRGRGRPRKQQQVSTPARRGHSAHPRRLCPGAPRPTGQPERGSAATGAAQACPLASGCRWAGDRFPHRRVRGASSRLPAPHSSRRWGVRCPPQPPGGRWGRARRVRGLSLLCAAPERRGVAGGPELLGSHRLKSIALSAAFATVQREGLPGTGTFRRVGTR